MASSGIAGGVLAVADDIAISKRAMAQSKRFMVTVLYEGCEMVRSIWLVCNGNCTISRRIECRGVCLRGTDIIRTTCTTSIRARISARTAAITATAAAAFVHTTCTAATIATWKRAGTAGVATNQSRST
jgi:hypothetical protein